MNRDAFILAARERYTKGDVKRFMKACDKRFGAAAIAEYRLNLTVLLTDGSLHAYSAASGRPQFYKVGI